MIAGDELSRAVVVMAKLPRAGRVKTRLLRALPEGLVVELYRAFLFDTFELVDRAAADLGSGLDRVLAVALAPDEAMDDAARLAPSGWQVIAQRGADLGARMAAARDDVGARAVVIVGSDAPELPPSRIVEAFAALDAGASARRVVLGPTTDGGYYLVGSTAPVPELFVDVPWSTPAVMATTRARAAAAGLEVVELPLAADVDDPDDLARLARALDASPDRAPHTRAVLDAHAARMGLEFGRRAD